MNIEQILYKYVELGLKPFPLRPDKKNALCKGWTNWDWNKNKKMIGKTPNWGIITDGVVAVDLDKRNGIDGYNKLIELADGREIPATALQQTPSGGYHLVYRTDVPLPSRIECGKTGPQDKTSIDIRGFSYNKLEQRMMYGLIVVEPSIYKGKSYKWEIPPCEIIADVPKWLADVILAGPNPNAPESRPRMPRDMDFGDVEPNALTLEMIDRYPITARGQRVDQMRRIVGSLANRADDPTIQDVVYRWWAYWVKAGLIVDKPERINVNSFFGANFVIHERKPRIQDFTIDKSSLKKTLMDSSPQYQSKKSVSFASYQSKKSVSGLTGLELDVVSGLVLHFYYEVNINGQDSDSIKATHSQIIGTLSMMTGKTYDKRNIGKVISRFISEPDKPASKLELLIRTAKGEKTKERSTPSVYECAGIETLFPAINPQKNAQDAHHGLSSRPEYNPTLF